MAPKFDRRELLLGGGAAALAAGAGRGEAGRIEAALNVDPTPLHELPKTQYGHFIEHLGQCIKGGIWAEGESEDMFLGGVRHELVAAMKSINPPLIRYPGGCFADGYHWKDGVGPRDKRPKRWNKAWGYGGPLVGPVDDNRFGTDEFVMLCREVGAEPQLTANVGSGTAEEAADWVEYCNGGADTKMGAERAKNGYPEPHNVKYWFVGNEIFGSHEIGWQPPEVYVNTLRAYSEAMRAKDPSIKLIAVGQGTEQNKIMLQGAGDIIDFLSIHQYVPSSLDWKNVTRFTFARQKGSPSPSIFYDVIGSLDHMRRFVESSVRDVRTFSPPGKKVPLSFDEWNLWFYFFADVSLDNFNLRDGLWTAAMLNLFHRHAPDMPLANIAQMVNCLGIIQSTRRGTFLTPSALAFKLYTDRAGREFLPSTVQCGPIPHETGIPALDASVTSSGDKLTLFLVNLHLENEIAVNVKLNSLVASPDAIRCEMNHRDYVKYNTPREPKAVKLIEKNAKLEVARDGSASEFTVVIPPHSLTSLEVQVERT